MSLYNIVAPASLVAGQPEDVGQVLANFQAIQAVLNGGIDDANIRSTAAITISKLAGYPSDKAQVPLGDGTWGQRTTPPTRTILTGSGNYTPPALCKAIIVECIGAGGGGGGAPSAAAGAQSAGGGGGGGGYAMKLFTPAGGPYAYSVGVGGAGVSNANGQSGGNTTFGSVTAGGGSGGGQTGPSAAPGNVAGGVGGGGAGSGGDLNITGDGGEFGYLYTNYPVGGRGGFAARGGAGGLPNLTNGADGNPGYFPGGGGSGGANSSNIATWRTGGSGNNGTIVVWEFY